MMVSVMLFAVLAVKPVLPPEPCPVQRAHGMRTAITEQAFGAPLVLSGSLGIVGGLVGVAVVLSKNDDETSGGNSAVIIPAVTIGIGLVSTIVGALLLNAGRYDARNAMMMECAPKINES